MGAEYVCGGDLGGHVTGVRKIGRNKCLLAAKQKNLLQDGALTLEKCHAALKATLDQPGWLADAAKRNKCTEARLPSTL